MCRGAGVLQQPDMFRNDRELRPGKTTPPTCLKYFASPTRRSGDPVAGEMFGNDREVPERWLECYGELRRVCLIQTRSPTQNRLKTK